MHAVGLSAARPRVLTPAPGASASGAANRRPAMWSSPSPPAALPLGARVARSNGRGLRRASSARAARVQMMAASSASRQLVESEFNDALKRQRLEHLEEQAKAALTAAVENFEHPVFPCALIAGDVVILELLDRLGYLASGKVQILFVDTCHLFEETISFLAEKEAAYGFRANVYHAVGASNKAEADAKYGKDMWKDDIEEYDRVFKVEPFQRGLKELQCDAMVNGRRRDHGFERAFIPMVEEGSPFWKINPLAYWTFEDCFDFLQANGVAYHPLHDEGYPSIGDAKDTVPVDRAKWFDYAGERAGRFTGLANKDGSKKTECGIHVDASDRQWDRDLWPAEGAGEGEGEGAVGPSAVVGATRESIAAYQQGALGRDVLLAVYAPWCPWCQQMEPEFEAAAQAVASDSGLLVAKYRGDEDREFVSENLLTSSFPTIVRFPKEGGDPVKLITSSEDQRTKDNLLAFLRDGSMPAAEESTGETSSML